MQCNQRESHIHIIYYTHLHIYANPTKYGHFNQLVTRIRCGKKKQTKQKYRKLFYVLFSTTIYTQNIIFFSIALKCRKARVPHGTRFDSTILKRTKPKTIKIYYILICIYIYVFLCRNIFNLFRWIFMFYIIFDVDTILLWSLPWNMVSKWAQLSLSLCLCWFLF